MLASSIIRFKFNWDVDIESAKSAFSITPAVAGQFVFKESNFVMEFVPNMPLDTTTVYTVKLAKTLKHYDGLNMVEDFIFSFKTMNRNKLSVLASYPLAGETNIDFKVPTFTVVFDKKLQTGELSNGVQVYDKQGKALTKNLRSVRNNLAPEPLGSTSFTLAQDLVPGQQYVLKLAKGIKDVDGVYLTDTLNFPFIATDERVVDKKVVETYETSGKYMYEPTLSVNVASATVTTSSATKLFGNYSNNMKFSFSSDVGGSVVYKVTNPEVEATNDSTIGLHIFGDLSGNEMYLLFASESDMKEIRVDSIHYGGWKFVEIVLAGLKPDTSYKFTGYKVVQRDAPLSKIGNIFIDNMLLYGAPVTSVSSEKVSRVSVYPNPASEIIQVKKDANQVVESMELYSLQGRLIKKSQQHFMILTGVPEGTYVIKLKLNDGVITKPVIIKR
jgi:hypothetical protein